MTKKIFLKIGKKNLNMNGKNKIKVGDFVIVKGFKIKAKISRIFMENSFGEETEFENECARIRMDLDWGDLGKSRISLHDENVIWFRAENLN